MLEGTTRPTKSRKPLTYSMERRAAGLKRLQEHEPPPLAEEPPEDARPALDEKLTAALSVLPEDRSPIDVDVIVRGLLSLGEGVTFFRLVQASQIQDIASGCRYATYPPGSTICETTDECAFLFVVLLGHVDVSERQISHKEAGRSEGKRRDRGGEEARRGRAAASHEEKMRTARYEQGRAFGDYPLVLSSLTYGYAARVPADAEGDCALLLLPKSLYTQVLRREVEKGMNDTVAMLKSSTSFFSLWSDTSIQRLYFWFTRQRLPPGTDVVVQGDAADSCFILRSGRCDILVNQLASGPAYDVVFKPGQAKLNSTREEEGDALEELSVDGLGEASEPTSVSESFRSESHRSESHRVESFRCESHRSESHRSESHRSESHSFKLKRSHTKHMRHVVTVKPGAMVGEIALFSDDAKRLATVRTRDHCELLFLDKKTFLDLDKHTLRIISDNARYNAACTKEPEQRSEGDIEILRERTANLTRLMSLPSIVKDELCRVMFYQKLTERMFVARKHEPVHLLRIIISGTCSAYYQEPQGSKTTSRRHSQQARARPSSCSEEAFAGLKAELLKEGDTIGEQELLDDEPLHISTVITNGVVELMEIPRADFDRILKAERATERGVVLDFLKNLPVMRGVSIGTINALSQLITHKTFPRGQLCLAHPPDASLGAASFSDDLVYLIFSGEARLMAAPNLARRDSIAPADGLPLASVDSLPQQSAAVLRSLGGKLACVATLGPGEVVADNLMGMAGARWCLKPESELRLLLLPRKEWNELVRQSSLAELKKLGEAKANFFQDNLAHVTGCDAVWSARSPGMGHRARSPPKDEGAPPVVAMPAPRLSKEGHELLQAALGRSKRSLSNENTHTGLDFLSRLTRIERNKAQCQPSAAQVLQKYLDKYSKPELGEDVEDVPPSEDEADEQDDEESEGGTEAVLLGA
ncbi:hypothetical protein AB1Y20_012560 [Prymnesium parvum]|uniref:Cyclic nucleotide-binding domain-containing protein n=1 Tax=Prymnesium parvum TaxID=97485 RepID=A0AB34IL66_PRYPA